MEFFTPCWFSLINLFSVEPKAQEIESILASVPQRLLECEALGQRSKPRAYDAILQPTLSDKNKFHITYTAGFTHTAPPRLYAECNDSQNTNCNTDFAACWFALARKPIFDSAPSIGYVKRMLSSVPQRLDICRLIIKEARRQGTEPLLAVAVAFKESLFTYTASTQSAVGPMGVVLKYYKCPHEDKSLCNPIEAGVSTLQKLHDLNSNDWCTPLAKYNAGECGRCDTPKATAVPDFCKDSAGQPKISLFEKSRSYAHHVYEIYEDLCETLSECYTC